MTWLRRGSPVIALALVTALIALVQAPVATAARPSGPEHTRWTTSAAVAVSEPTGKLLYTVRAGFVSEIWTIERNGTGATKLVDGMTPSFSPDGKWVVYTELDESTSNSFIKRIPVDGGASERLSGPVFPADDESFTHQVPRYLLDQRAVLHDLHESELSGEEFICRSGIARTEDLFSELLQVRQDGLCGEQADCVPQSVYNGEHLMGAVPSSVSLNRYAWYEDCESDPDGIGKVKIAGTSTVVDNATLNGAYTADGKVPIQRLDPETGVYAFELLDESGGLTPQAADLNAPYDGRAPTVAGCIADVSGSGPFAHSPDGNLVGWTTLGMAPTVDGPGVECTEDTRGIWIATPGTGSGMRQVVAGDDATLWDLQCTPGNCLTGVLITKDTVSGLDHPGTYPSTFTYTAGSRSATLLLPPPNPFEPPSSPTTVLRLAPGTHTVTESMTPGWSLTDIACAGASVDLGTRSATLTLTEDSGLVPCTFTSTSTNEPPSECEIDPASCEPDPPEKCRVYSSTTYGARAGSASGADILAFELADTRFCHKSGKVRFTSAGRAVPDYVAPASTAGVLAALGMKFKYKGATAPRVLTFASGGAQVTTTGRWDFCVQIPVPVLNKGVGAILKYVPKPVQKFLLRASMKAIAKTSLLTTALKQKLARKALARFIEKRKSSLTDEDKEALKYLAKFIVKTAFERLEEALLKLMTDGYCTKKVWEPEITVSVTKTGVPSSDISGDPAIFTVLPFQP